MRGLNSSSSESSIDSGIDSPGHGGELAGSNGALSRGSPVSLSDAITSSSLNSLMVRFLLVHCCTLLHLSLSLAAELSESNWAATAVW